MNHFHVGVLLAIVGLSACRNRQFNSETRSVENPNSLRGTIPAEISCIEDPNLRWNYTVRVTGAGSCEMVAAKGQLEPLEAEICSAKTSVEEGGVRYQIALHGTADSPERFMNVLFINGKGKGDAQFANSTRVVLKCGFLSGGGLANPENNSAGNSHGRTPTAAPADSSARYKCLGYEGTKTYSSKEECLEAGCSNNICVKAN